MDNKIKREQDTCRVGYPSSRFDREIAEIVGIDRHHLCSSQGAICGSAPGQSKNMGKGKKTQN